MLVIGIHLAETDPSTFFGPAKPHSKGSERTLEKDLCKGISTRTLRYLPPSSIEIAFPILISHLVIPPVLQPTTKIMSSTGEKRKANPSLWKPTSKHFVPRYTGPSITEMTTEQRSIRDAILASRPGTGLNGPFGPWLAVPSIAQPAQTLGKACRYGTSLSRRESELVILLTGSKFQSHTEFDIHVGEALESGIDLDIIHAIPRDEEFSLESVNTALLPLLSDDRERSIVQFAAEMLETSKVSEATYAGTKLALGGKDSVLVEITSIVGYYAFVSYTLNVFQIPS